MRIIKTILLFCLISFSMAAVFITPTYPPTAFQNQYYIVVFRIRGADYPVFRFTGLPQGLIGATNGTVLGVPKVSGSFRVNLTYVANGNMGWREFIFTVTPDFMKKSSDSVINIKNTKNLIIAVPENLLFVAWQKLIMKFEAKLGQEPYVWSFGNLPKGLMGNPKSGEIIGIPREQGYFNINVEVADSMGKSASAFITINIQAQIKAESAKSLVQGLLQNPQSLMDPAYVKFVLEYTADDLVKAQADVKQKRSVKENYQKVVDGAMSVFDNSNQTYFDSENELTKANINKKNAELAVTDSQKLLDDSKNQLNLSSIEANSSTLRLKESQSNFNSASKRLNDSQKLVDSNQTLMTTSTSAYQKAENSLKIANQSRLKFLQSYKSVAQQLQTQKQKLEETKKNKQIADLKVSSARDLLLLVTQAKDFAQVEFKKADLNFSQLENGISSNNAKISGTRADYNKIKKELDSLQQDLDFKLNALYLAQARKQAADRVTAFALAEGSLSQNNAENQSKTFGSSSFIGGNSTESIGNQSLSFKGCDQVNYPSISGTSQIVSMSNSNKSITLLSGRMLIYGDCSSLESIKTGDWIKFEGYLVSSVVNAIKVKKTSFLQ